VGRGGADIAGPDDGNLRATHILADCFRDRN
jgi:hypothetical protein